MIRSFTLTAIITIVLQHLGATAPALQKFFLHSAQPLLVSVIFLLGKYVINHPLFFLAFLPVLGYFLYLYLSVEPKEESSEGQIHPLPLPARPSRANQVPDRNRSDQLLVGEENEAAASQRVSLSETKVVKEEKEEQWEPSSSEEEVILSDLFDDTSSRDQMENFRYYFSDNSEGSFLDEFWQSSGRSSSGMN
jgi:hypothetical protein